MAAFALIDYDTGAFVEERSLPEGTTSKKRENGQPMLLPIVVTTDESNPLTQSYGAPIYTVHDDYVAKRFPVVDLPAEVAAANVWADKVARARVITPRQFRLRLTDFEQDVIDEAAMTDKDVFKWRMRAAEAQEIDLEDPETEQGIDFLIFKGLLASERKAVILGGN